jgi:hypothetical protein
MIHKAEVRLFGARMLPTIETKLQFREADRYEMVGIVDVVTHVELSDSSLSNNPLVQLFSRKVPTTSPGKFEIIVDYKGMRRPPAMTSARGGLWDQYAWQVQTYAELRRKQSDALPVIAGVLLYVNELYPTQSDLQELKKEIKAGLSDVLPAPGSVEEQLILEWAPGKPVPVLPIEFKLERAVRVIPVDYQAIQTALESFDLVVKDIETCRGREWHGAPVLQAWTKNSSDEQTCVVCDSRTYCPEYQAKYAKKHGDTEPRLPAVRSREDASGRAR